MTEINRRTVTRGIAWSVPVVAVAGAAPAFAASGPTPTISLGTACKSPGNSCKSFPKGYRIPAKICNPGAEDIWIYTVELQTGGVLALELVKPTLPIKVEANDCIDILLEASASNSGNKEFTLTTISRWGHSPTDGADDRQGEHDNNPMVGTLYIPGTPPDCECGYDAAPAAYPYAAEEQGLSEDASSAAETAEAQDAPEAPVVEETDAVEAPVVEETQVVEAPAAEVTEEVAVETEAPVATNA